MTIHHSIVKRAATLGIVLTSDDDSFRAHHTASGIVIERDIEDGTEPTEANDAAKDAIAAIVDIQDWTREHDSFLITFEDDDFVGYARNAKGQRGQELARDPELADLFETLEAIEADGDELADDDDEGDEDEEGGGSVVPERYKVEYAARGDVTTCGDWLALEINKLCHVNDEGGKQVTDLDRLEAIANANDVAPARYGKLGVESRGWQGRFRMTIRNMLTPRVAAKGFLFIPEGCGVDKDTERKAPKQWCLEHAPKPKKEANGKAAAKGTPAKGTPAKPKGKKAAAKDKAELGLETAREALKSVKAKQTAAAAQ